MKIYLAAQYSWRDRMKEYARVLERMGIEITSSWLRERKPLGVDLVQLSDRFNKEHAAIDIDDLDAADTLLLFTVDPTTPIKRGGRHFETGYMYAQKKRVIICGPKENIFHYLGDIVQFDTFEEVVDYLQELKDRAW